jgi:exonuclease SbcC
MVPTELTLENFLSYRERQTLPLGELDLAVVSGENGNGKSALFDAITWALWGEARKPSGKGKPDSTLLNRPAKRSEGPTEMSVELTFSVEGDTYTACRSYRESATGKTTTGDLRFYSEKPEDNHADLTAGSMRDTQELITETVHVEYDTFINTSFLLQGRSDELTQKRPAERKEVLSNVLRLGRFDELSEKCLRRRREVKTSIGKTESRIEHLGSQLEGAEKRKEALKEATSRLAEHKTRKTELEEKIGSVEEKISEAKAAKQKASRIKSEMSDLRSEKSQLEDEIEELKQKIKEGESVDEKAESIRDQYNRQQKLQRQLNDLQEQQAKHRRLHEKKREAEEELQAAQKNAEHKRRSAEEKLKRAKDGLRKFHSGPPEKTGWEKLADATVESLEDRLQEAKARQDAIEEVKKTKSEKKSSLSDVKSEITELKSEISVAQSDLASRKEDTQQIQSMGGNRCPRCGSEVTDEHVQKEIEKAQQDIWDLEDELETLREDLSGRQERASELESSISRLENELGDLRGKPHPDPIREDLSEARELRAKAENASETVSSSKEELMRRAGKDPEALKAQLESAQEKVEALGFDQDRVSEVRSELKGIPSDIGEKKTELERALDKLDRWREKLGEKQSELESAASEIEALQAERKPLLAEAERLQALEPEKSQLEKRRSSTESDIEEAQQDVGRLENQIETDEENAEALENAKNKLSDLQNKQRLLEHLREAFSKHGIPSLIIESVIPDLEARANDLLSRLTGGMKLRLETTRETQSGDTTDTLQILIEDEIGSVRPYESYSGGEGFRANFALRVALSQLLARRSGAPLRTLVVDEGFGTQDANGLRAVKQAISEVASDFELVMVITHLEELKESFPQRVEVEKTPGRGSTFAVHN